MIEKLQKTCISNKEEIEHLNEVIYFMPINPTDFDVFGKLCGLFVISS